MTEVYVESRYQKFTYEDTKHITVKYVGKSNTRVRNGKIYTAWWEDGRLYILDANGFNYNIQYLNGNNGANWKPIAIHASEETGGFANAFNTHTEHVKSTEEEKMAQVEHVKFEETTLIDDEPTSMYSNDTLLTMVQEQTKAADNLRATGVVGKYIDQEVKHYIESAARLSELLDERVKEE